MCFEVKWCGHILGGGGVRHDPERRSALSALPLPKPAGDLQQFLCACNRIRESIVDYAWVTEILQAKINQALNSRSRTRRSAAAVQPQWSDTERSAYSSTLNPIALSANQYFPEETATVCLSTDALDYGHSSAPLERRVSHN